MNEKNKLEEYKIDGGLSAAALSWSEEFSVF